MPLAYWVHDLSPFLIRFSDNVGIRYYGLAYVLGFVGAVWLLHRYHRAGRSPFGSNTIGDLITYIVFGVMLGGRLGYFLLYQSEAIFRDPLALLRVWEGGMASHGGFVGVLFALILFARRHHVSFFPVSDLIATTAALGLFFGRVANFINGELRKARRPGRLFTSFCLATRHNFTRPHSKARCSLRGRNGGSGVATSPALTRDDSQGSFCSPTRWCACSANRSANPTPRFCWASVAARFTRSF